MKKLLFATLLLLAVPILAQNSRQDGIVFTRSGFPAPGASVAVCSLTSITAASETANTVTITTTLNPPQGSTVLISGITPAGYNGSYTVLTTSGTNFTYTNPVSGLGAGSAFGEVVVTSAFGGVLPCQPLASTCASNVDASCVSPNPVTADGLGNYSFYIKPGRYLVQSFGSGLTARNQIDQVLPCDPSNCTIAGALTAQSVNGIINAALSSGADIGAKINNSCASANGQTVWVPGSTAGSFATTIAPANSCHILFDQGQWTYTGSTNLLTWSNNGLVIEGGGSCAGQPSGATCSSASGTQLIATNTAANGFNIGSGGATGLVIRGLTLIGPNSGTGFGLWLSANAASIEDVQTRAWGSDGVRIDGTRANSNNVNLYKVVSISNKGWGFNLFGVNANVIDFLGTTGQGNTLGNYQIATTSNFFGPAHSDSSGTGTGFTFLSGALHNHGDVYSESGNETTAVNLNSGASNNFFILTSQCARTNNGTNNTISCTTLAAASGNAANPGYALEGDTGTGFFDLGGGAWGWASGGTQQATLNSAGLILVGKIAAGGTQGTGTSTGDITTARSSTSGAVSLGTDGNSFIFRPGPGNLVELFPVTNTWQAGAYATASNCSSSGGTCGSAAAGSVSIAAAATTVTVATTTVTANSQVFIQEDSSLGTKLGVTCNTTTGRTYTVTTRTGGTSFVVTASAAPTTNPACLSYFIVN